MILTLLLVGVVVAGFTLSNVVLALGMGTSRGALHASPSSGTPKSMISVIRFPLVLAGIALQGAAFAAYLLALSRADLSWVFPLTALSDVLAVIAGRYLLGETIVATRWMGVCVITAGVVCIGLS